MPTIEKLACSSQVRLIANYFKGRMRNDISLSRKRRTTPLMTMIHWYFHSQNVIEEAWLRGVESDRRKLPRRKRAEGRRGATPLLRPSFSDEWNPTRGQRFYRQSSRRQEQSLRTRWEPRGGGVVAVGVVFCDAAATTSACLINSRFWQLMRFRRTPPLTHHDLRGRRPAASAMQAAAGVHSSCSSHINRFAAEFD